MQRRQSLTSYMGWSLIWIVAISGAVLFIHGLGWLHPVETLAIEDAAQLLKSARIDDNVVTVTIDQEVFDKFFHGHYPLEPQGVKDLLRAIGAGKPRLIGVDINTTKWKPKDRRDLPRVPIIWARAATVDENQVAHPLPVLGGGIALQSAEAGVAVFPKDRDGLFRSYRRTVEVAGGGVMPSFPWALYAKYKGFGASEVSRIKDQEIGLNFAADFIEILDIPAAHVLEVAHPTPSRGWVENSPIRNKIVLLGGTYIPARDLHPTPVGERTGVQIAAQALSAEINGTGIRPVRPIYMWLVEIFIGLLLALVQYHSRGGRAVVLTLCLIFVSSILASWAMYRTAILWANFVPVWLAVFLHNVWEAHKENTRLRSELAEARADLVKAQRRAEWTVFLEGEKPSFS